MEIRNCPQCGKVFTFIRTNMCPECQQKDEECFKKVRSYIAMHPGANMLTVSEETEVSEDKIMRYMREGRITSKNLEMKVDFHCEVCGDIITSGRICSACMQKLSSGLKKSILEENKKVLEEISDNNNKSLKQGPRMHTADYYQQKKGTITNNRRDENR